MFFDVEQKSSNFENIACFLYASGHNTQLKLFTKLFLMLDIYAARKFVTPCIQEQNKEF